MYLQLLYAPATQGPNLLYGPGGFCCNCSLFSCSRPYSCSRCSYSVFSVQLLMLKAPAAVVRLEGEIFLSDKLIFIEGETLVFPLYSDIEKQE